MERLEKRRKLTYSTAARACLCAASRSTAFRAVSSMHLGFLLSLKFRKGVCLSVCFTWMVSLLYRGTVMLKEGLIRKGGDAGLISS